MKQHSLFDVAYRCLKAEGVEEKLRLTEEAGEAWKSGFLHHRPARLPHLVEQAGHPVKPPLLKSENRYDSKF